MRAKRPYFEALESRMLYAADLTDAFAGTIPASFAPGGKESITVRVTNAGNIPAAGTANVILYASTDQALDAGDVQIATATLKSGIKSHATANAVLKFTAPTNLNTDNYFLLADIVPSAGVADGNPNDKLVATPSTVSITAPFVNLTDTVAIAPTAGTYTVGAKKQKPLKLTLTVTNRGNIAASGPFGVTVFGSFNQTLDAQDPALITLPTKPLSLKAGQSKKLTINFTPTAATPSGTFYLIAEANSGANPAAAIAENTTQDDTAASTGQFTINNPALPRVPKLVGGLTDDILVVVVGNPESVTFSATVSGEALTTAVEIDEVDASGNLIGKIADLHDSGSSVDRDETAGDGLFSGVVPIAFNQTGTKFYVAKVTDTAANTTVQSASLAVNGVNPLTDAQLATDEADVQNVANAGLAVVAANGTAQQVLAAITAAVASDPNAVPGSIDNEPDAVYWKALDGTFAGMSVDVLMGVPLSAVDNDTDINDPPFAMPAAATTTKAAASAHAAIIQPADDTDDDDDQSAIVLDPFAREFQPDDEAPEVAQMLTNHNYSVTFAANTEVTLADYESFSQYAAVAVVTHGTYDYFHGPYMMLGMRSTSVTAEEVSADLLNNRLVHMGMDEISGTYAATPSFFTEYGGGADGAIVYLGACNLGNDSKMADAFLGAGAAAVLAYSLPVASDFAAKHGLATFNTLLQDTHNTVGDIPGLHDQDMRNPPRGRNHRRTTFEVFGDLTATLPNNDVLLTDVNLVVTYRWPADQPDLDSRTTFLGASAGFELPGSQYMRWFGDSQGNGGSETTEVDLYDAWKAGLLTPSTMVGAGADWYLPLGGEGPATISVALENIVTEKEFQIQTAVVTPGEETDGASDIQENIQITLTGDPTNPAIKIKLVKIAP